MQASSYYLKGNYAKYLITSLNLKTMKKVMISAAVLMSMTLSFVACKKNDNPTISPIPGSYTTLNSAFAGEAPKSKTVTINATTGASFYGNSGTRYAFLPNSFQTSSGGLVSGNVDIEVLECTNNADMIFGRMLTMSDGQTLISGGEIRVKASQAGNNVYIRPGMTYNVNMPTNKGAATSDMSFFRGRPTETFLGTTTNWGLSRDSFMSIVYNGDTIGMTPDSLGDSNIDKFTSAGVAKVDIKLSGISGTIDVKNVMAYYLLEGYLSVASLPTTNFFSNTYNSQVMLKMQSHIVACCIYSGDFYAGTLASVTPTDGTVYTLNLNKMSPAAFKTMINALK